jgi:SAM-dependent methyltransferase
MDHASIAAAYDALAGRWTDAAFDPDNGLRLHAQALSFLGDGEGRALSVGCGCNTRFNPLLRERGLRLEGIDISARMLALAAQADPGVVLYHADVCAWQPPHAYRFISAWDSIWHVRLGRQHALMLTLMRALEPGGVFLFSAGGLDAPDEHSDAAMGPQVYYGTLGIPGLLDVVEEAGCMLRHFEFDQLPEQHLCVVVQRPA